LAAAAGLRYRLITLRRPRTPKALADGQILVRPVARALVDDQQKKRSSVNSLILVLTTAWWLLWHHVELAEFDQIPHASLPLGLAACKITGKRSIVHWFEAWSLRDWQRYLGVVLGTFAFAAEHVTFRWSDAMAISDFTAQRLRAIHGQPRKKIPIVPPGFAVPAPVALGKRRFQLGFVGRLLPHKHVEEFLKVVASIRKSIPDVHAVVVGDGEHRAAAEALAGSLGLTDTVHFTGKLESHDEVMKMLGQIELLVVCSEREGFGLVVLEANSRGVPVLVRSYPSNAAVSLVQDGVNGRVCHSTHEVVEDAVAYLQDQGSLTRLQRGALTTSRLFSPTLAVDSLLRAYGLSASGSAKLVETVEGPPEPASASATRGRA
jgi:glycosyltransferase involved in cell wall biosynthesis